MCKGTFNSCLVNINNEYRSKGQITKAITLKNTFKNAILRKICYIIPKLLIFVNWRNFIVNGVKKIFFEKFVCNILKLTILLVQVFYFTV